MGYVREVVHGRIRGLKPLLKTLRYCRTTFQEQYEQTQIQTYVSCSRNANKIKVKQVNLRQKTKMEFGKNKEVIE